MPDDVTSHVPAPAVTIPHQSGYDLRALFRSVGRFAGHRALTSTPEPRPEPEVPAELLDAGPSKVHGEALEVGAYLDGVQAALDVAYRAHRPVHLIYVGAGAVDDRYRPVGLRDELFLTCSVLDREWVDQLDGGLPVEEIGEESPAELERLGLALLAGRREMLERHLAKDLADQGHTPLVVDGSLAGRPVDLDVVGVVKTTRRRYLADESCLFGLPAGWRSPRFKIKAGTAGAGADRYSAYVRMVAADDAPWNFGLIRVEAYDPQLLDPLAARCLDERQRAAGGDRRWDRHLSGVRHTEEFLRARRPWVFRSL